MPCLKCGYKLDGLPPTSPDGSNVKCPECGTVSAPNASQRISRAARWKLIALTAGPIAAPPAWLLVPHIVSALRTGYYDRWVMVGAVYLGMFWFVGVVVWGSLVFAITAVQLRGRDGALSAVILGVVLGIAISLALLFSLAFFQGSGGC